MAAHFEHHVGRGQRRLYAALVAAVLGTVITACGSTGGSVARPPKPVTVGANLVSQTNDQMTFRIDAPAGSGKPSGSVITTRVTPSTHFAVQRDKVGTTVPLVITIDTNENPDGTLDLISLEAPTR